MSNKYTPTIGIEIHTQLATKSKMFCGCDNASIDAEPNTNVCPVCLALPGSLPVINKGAVELAIRMGYGLNSKIATNTSFDRKNYFYPDSPKGYQITQMDQPIIQNGHVEILVDGELKKIGIHHAHLEEDAGKSTHPAGANYSLVDFNRAGTPLVEIVSDPDMHSPLEAKRYLQEVYAIVTTLGVTHGDLQHGNFKFDLNVSVSDTDKLGIRTELKNLNSFRNAERALIYEINRQIEVLESGQPIEQETRGFNDSKGTTFSQRGKEFAHDYRYFPEPDLPPLVLTKDFIQSTQDEISDIELPLATRKRLIEFGLSEKEQDILILQPDTCTIYFEAIEKINNKVQSKQVLNYLIGDYQAWLSDNPTHKSKLTGANLAELLNQVDSGSISTKAAKDIFVEIILGSSADKIIKDKGLVQISDDSELELIIQKIIDDNPKAVADYKAGNEKALGFFVGKVMAATKGQANPGKTNQLVLKLLDRN
jgi:aspartyl-tRNA(Asn)/glutamyl-tRNA(Gln) amidotransferase subunit B